jgi:hypothetical protein
VKNGVGEASSLDIISSWDPAGITIMTMISDCVCVCAAMGAQLQ